MRHLQPHLRRSRYFFTQWNGWFKLEYASHIFRRLNRAEFHMIVEKSYGSSGVRLADSVSCIIINLIENMSFSKFSFSNSSFARIPLDIQDLLLKIKCTVDGIRISAVSEERHQPMVYRRRTIHLE
jgi:hypothetical protein